MRRVTFKAVRDKAVALYLGAGPSSAGASAANAQTIAALDIHLNKRAGECWERFFWPEWTIVEPRTFREPWNSASTYAALDERYYRPAQKYAVALTASTGQAPYSLSGGSYVINSAYWAEVATSYAADNYASTRTYVRGEFAYYPETDTYYALFAATSTGNAPTDATKWGELPRFKRNLEHEQAWEETVIGEFKNIWDDDPERNADACEIKFVLASEGAIVRGDQGRVYAEFRTRVPEWTGATFSAGTHASAAAGTQVYDNALGDYYQALITTPGADLTDATKWLRLDFPYVLREAVPQLAYADLLRGDGMNEKAFALELGEGWRLLNREFDKIERQQKQHKTLNVRMR
jgi:hypothetical protein